MQDAVQCDAVAACFFLVARLRYSPIMPEFLANLLPQEGVSYVQIKNGTDSSKPVVSTSTVVPRASL